MYHVTCYAGATGVESHTLTWNKVLCNLFSLYYLEYLIYTNPQRLIRFF